MSNLAKARFLKALRVHVLPLLREEGFEGTYPTFCRAVAKQLVHVIQFQATQLGGGGVYVNLGVYLSPLDHSRPKPSSEKILPQHCEIQTRLQDLAGVSDRFCYGDTDEDTELSVLGLSEMMRLEGLYFFQQFGSYPEAFAKRIKDAARYGVAYRGPLAPEVSCGAAETYAALAVLLSDEASLGSLIERIRTTWTAERDKSFGDERAAPFEAKQRALAAKRKG